MNKMKEVGREDFRLLIDYQRCYYGIMSYHALTSMKSPIELAANIKYV